MMLMDLPNVQIGTFPLQNGNIVISVYYSPTIGISQDLTILQLVSISNKCFNQYSLHWYNKQFTEKEIKHMLLTLNFKCVLSTKLTRRKTKEIYKVTDKTRLMATLLSSKADLPNIKRDIA